MLGLLYPVAGGVLRRGLKFKTCTNTLNNFLTIPGIFGSPNVQYYAVTTDCGKLQCKIVKCIQLEYSSCQISLNFFGWFQNRIGGHSVIGYHSDHISPHIFFSFMKESFVVTQYYANVMNTLCEQNAEVPLILVGSAYNNRCALTG